MKPSAKQFTSCVIGRPGLLCSKFYLPYSGKVWWGKSLANWASRSFDEEKFGECL